MAAHALAKASLFLSAGTVLYALGTDRIDKLSGLSERLPITTLSLGIAGVVLVGIPPSGIFVAKWYLFGAAIGSGQWWWAVVIGAGTLLTGAYVFRVVRVTFTREPGPSVLQRMPRAVQAIGLVLALASLALGLVATGILPLLEQSSIFTSFAGSRS